MAQDRYKINGREIFQPDKDLSLAWETTYTDDSSRTQDGKGHFTPLFTVYQHGYSASHVPVAEATWIISVISTGAPFILHGWSPKYGEWRDINCYVGKSADCTVGSLEDGKEYYTTFAFNATEVDAERV